MIATTDSVALAGYTTSSGSADLGGIARLLYSRAVPALAVAGPVAAALDVT
ncbi:hypothetical protein [Mycobacterium decipiens]|uniref:hypothetical protein n=1 Tax=Mycobacterium decipiens TaxID=1430326 RepID=UPI0013FDD31C|nr:hypothetical protein [Mycobacterium decipiens]